MFFVDYSCVNIETGYSRNMNKNAYQTGGLPHNGLSHNRTYLDGCYLATIAFCSTVPTLSLFSTYKFIRSQNGSAAFAFYAKNDEEAAKVAEHLFLTSDWDLKTAKFAVCKFSFSLLESEISTSMLGDKIPLDLPE